jgi:hypothetical protein
MFNKIGDKGAQHLADALQNNTVTLIFSSTLSYPHLHFFAQTLTTLDLEYNQIGEELQHIVSELIEQHKRRAKS